MNNNFKRWDALDEKIKTAQKTLGVQSQQWNSYQETLLQTINWLESVEKVIASNQSPIWSSPQEIRSKLLKQKVLNITNCTLTLNNFLLMNYAFVRSIILNNI